LALSLLLCASSIGCNVHFDVSHRSGSVDDDYVGEPLTDDVRKYEHALEVSNDFLRRFRKDEYEAIDAELCSREFHELCGAEGLADIGAKAKEHYGTMLRYKPQQWGFASSTRDGRRLLCSTKIIECERTKVRCNFVFADDGKYEKLLGVHFSEWKGALAPGQQ
jgi:hypothetical protein